MGFITRIIRNSYSLSDFDRDISKYFYGWPSKTGVNVNEQTAMTYTAVFSCIRVLSETLASLPLYIYKKRANGGKDKATDHPLYDLLLTAPNNEMPSMAFRETLMAHICTSGNCYAFINANRRGQVAELYPVNWMQITPQRNSDTLRLEYKFYDRGKEEIIPSEKVLHIPGLGFDGIKGYSPIHMAMEAVGLGLAAESFGAAFYGNGVNSGGVLEHPNALSDKAYNRLKESLKEEHGGLDNAFNPLILEEGMKFNKITIPPNEAQFLETRRFQLEEIARIYRVPLHLVGNLEKATFSNIEQQALEFIQFTMLPWFSRWEQYINFKLLTKQERQQGYFAEFYINELLRGDAASRSQYLHLMRQDGVINADEWREMEGMNPQEGNQGKTYFMNGNMVSEENADKQMPKQSKGGADKNV